MTSVWWQVGTYCDDDVDCSLEDLNTRCVVMRSQNEVGTCLISPAALTNVMTLFDHIEYVTDKQFSPGRISFHSC